jgi:hypothetical protein
VRRIRRGTCLCSNGGDRADFFLCFLLLFCRRPSFYADARRRPPIDPSSRDITLFISSPLPLPYAYAYLSSPHPSIYLSSRIHPPWWVLDGSRLPPASSLFTHIAPPFPSSLPPFPVTPSNTLLHPPSPSCSLIPTDDHPQTSSPSPSARRSSSRARTRSTTSVCAHPGFKWVLRFWDTSVWRLGLFGEILGFLRFSLGGGEGRLGSGRREERQLRRRRLGCVAGMRGDSRCALRAKRGGTSVQREPVQQDAGPSTPPVWGDARTARPELVAGGSRGRERDGQLSRALICSSHLCKESTGVRALRFAGKVRRRGVGVLVSLARSLCWTEGISRGTRRGRVKT